MPVRPRILTQPAFCVPVVRETPRPPPPSREPPPGEGAVGTGTRTAGRLLPAVPTPLAAARVSAMSLLQIALMSSIQRDRTTRPR